MFDFATLVDIIRWVDDGDVHEIDLKSRTKKAGYWHKWLRWLNGLKLYYVRLRRINAVPIYIFTARML